MGPTRVDVDKIVAGNIAAVTGLGDAIVGSTVHYGSCATRL